MSRRRSRSTARTARNASSARPNLLGRRRDPASGGYTPRRESPTLRLSADERRPCLRLNDDSLKDSPLFPDVLTRRSLVAMSEQRYRWPQMGQLFVEKGRLTSEQLASALEQQRETGEPLGEILVARNHISRIDLAAALSTQWSWREEESATDDAPEQRAAAVAVEETSSATTDRAEEPEADGRLVADLQARLRGAYEQLAAAEARLEVLEPAVDDLTKAFGVLNAQLHARGEELAEIRAASARREEQIAAAARALLG